MITSLATLNSFWFIFGLGCGTITTCILLILVSFLDDKPKRIRHAKEIEKAREETYKLARDWRIAEQVYVESEIDDLWYEIEEIKRKLSMSTYDGLFADGKPIKKGDNVV